MGDAVATVRQHCAESRESPEEAFGDPQAYARSLAAGASGRAEPLTARTLLGALAGVAGLMATSVASSAALEGGPAQIQWGQVWLLAVTMVAVIAVVVRSGTVLRALVRFGPVGGGLAAVAVLASMVGVTLLWPGVLATVPAGVLAVFAVLLLSLATGAAWPDRHGDPERDPSTGGGGRTGAAGLVGVLAFPVAAVLVAAQALLIHLLA